MRVIPLQAISKALARIEGSYAFAILFDDHPDRVYGARKDSPLIAAVGQGENFILSDISATLKYTKDYYVLEDRRHCGDLPGGDPYL